MNVLLVAAACTGLVGLTYAWVGHRLRRRPPPAGSSGKALRLFALWWSAMALNQALWALVNGAAALGYASLDAQITYGVVQRMLLPLALWGLLSYLVYVLTGRDASRPLAVAYALYLVLTLYGFHWNQPVDVHFGSWRVDLDYARRPPPAVQALMLLALVGPPVGAALAYGRHWREAPDARARARMLTQSVGLVVWWVLTVAAALPSTLDLAWLQALNRLVGLLVAGAILLAYEPASWLTRRLGFDHDDRAAG